MNSTDQKRKDLEEDEEEEALSLCDFPQNSDSPEEEDSSTTHHQPPDSFEFFSDLNSNNISHAEDIISCGKLVPYRFDERILKSASEDYDSINASRRYCDSLPKRSNSCSGSTTLRRSSRSVDFSKLRRNSSLEASDIHRSFSKGSGHRPRWYSLMFGSVKFPPEMDLRDIKNRQVRLMEGGGGVPANRRSSWGHDLLRVLSCKNHPSVAVTSSIGLVPQL